MIPGKSYSPDELLAIVWARKWRVAILVVLGACLAFGFAKTLPTRYQSETTIMVIPQRVPESYVRSTVTARIEDRLKSISQEIRSRVRLERIINEYDLYRDLRRKHSMDDILQRMQDDFDVRLIGGDSFRVSYVSDTPDVAMKVTARLASLFIEENLRDRSVVADDTSEFIDTQLKDALQRLVEQEKRLEDYRRLYANELPTQLAANQQVLQNLQMQLQTLQDSLGRDRDRRLALDRDLADLSAQLAASQSPAPLKPAASGPAATAPAAGESAAVAALEKERANLQGLMTRYTGEHPDVIRVRQVVRDLERQVATESRVAPADPAAPPPAPNPVAAARQERIRQLRHELDATDRQVAAKQADARGVRDTMDQVRRHIDATPTRESELTSLTRDYDTISKWYTNLLGKKEDSKISANLERRQIGEQFRILDPARLPTMPSSPNRPKITATGAAIGFGLALAFIALLEYRNSGLRTEEEIAGCTGLPVLAVIPLMVSTDVRPKPTLKRLLGPLSDGTTQSG